VTEEVQMELFEPAETIRRVSAVHKNIIELLTKERFYDVEIDRNIREQLQRFIPKTDIESKVGSQYARDKYRKIQEQDEYWLKRIFGPEFHLKSNEQ
jgi:hypothetical protein